MRVLMAWDREGKLSLLLEQEAKKHPSFSERDQAFARRLVFGTVRWQLYLDYVLGLFSSTPVNKMRPAIHWILLLGSYQLLIPKDIPESAAVNESVILAKQCGFGRLSGFVNAILRRIAENKDKISAPAGEDASSYSIRYSCPEWLVNLWITQWGRDRTKEILEASLSDRPLTVRIPSGFREKDALLREWEAQGVNVKPHPFCDEAFLLEKVNGIRNLKGYREGAFIVQDASSMLPVYAAGLMGNERILDVCASPGGKSLFAAEKLTTGHILAGDISAKKLQRLSENIRRMHMEERVEPALRDASLNYPEDQGQYNVVFADLPCSGLGVLSKKPELKYRLTKESIQELVQLQRKILAASVKCLKPGGLLIYSTCTVNRAENREQAEWIEQELGLRPEPIVNHLPEGFRELCSEESRLQVFPGACRDGFYTAGFRRPND